MEKRERIFDCFRIILRKILRIAPPERVKPKKEITPQKAAIAIDGENLYKSLRMQLGGVAVSDFREFCRRLITKVGNVELFGRPTFYTSVDWRTKTPNKTLEFFSRLAEAGFKVEAKPLPKGKDPTSEIDPWVSDGIYRLALEDISVIILVSGDHHFVPSVKFSQEKGKKVIAVSTEASIAAELKEVCNQWINLEDIIEGITYKPRIEQKREEALAKLNAGKRIVLPTFHEVPNKR